MNRKPVFVFIGILATIYLATPAYAFGPVTHVYLSNQALDDPRLANSPIAQTIKNHRDCFDAGMTETDITVIFYYTSGAKYEATHNHRFANAFLSSATIECERAFAYGIEVHLIQDSLSHNSFIPGKITASLVPNWLIHPIEEAKIEAHVIRDHPDSFQQLRNSLNVLDTTPSLVEKTQDQIYASTGIVLDVEALTGVLREAIASPNGFYTKYFALPDIYESVSEGNIYWGIGFIAVGGILFLINWNRIERRKWYEKFFTPSWLPIFGILYLGYFFSVGGLAGITDISDANQVMRMSIDRTVEVLQPANWETRYVYDPTGFEKLSQADAQVYAIDMGIALVAGLLILAYLKFWRGKK